TAYIINGNNVRLLNATAGIQTAGVSNAQITFNTIELQKPLTYTAPTTTGIDLGGGGGNFLSCNHVSGHTVDSVPRYGYRIAQSQGNTIQCNVADSTSYSFRFEGVACKNTLLKGNYMGNAYCGLYLNQDAIIGQQPDSSNPPYHGNVWLDPIRYTSGFGAVNMNAQNQPDLFFSLFTTNTFVNAHNPIIPGLTLPPPFLVNNNGWFDPQNSGGSFDCQHSYVCMAALQDSGDLPPDDQLRMRVVNDSSVSSLFIPESKQIASQIVFADLKTDSVSWAVNAYLDFIEDKEDESEGIIYQIDSTRKVIEEITEVRNIEVYLRWNQIRSLTDSILMADSLLSINSSNALSSIKENLIDRVETIKEQLRVIQQNHAVSTGNSNGAIYQFSSYINPKQIPDANYKEVNRLISLYRNNGLNSLIDNYDILLNIATQCPSSGGPAVFTARHLLKTINDSIVFDDVNTCMQLGIFRMASQQPSNAKLSYFNVVPNPATHEARLIIRRNTMKDYSLSIFNEMGQIVSIKEYKNVVSNLSFSVSSLNNGVYSVVLKGENESPENCKLVIVR
ncbi:MAG TPA: T9SS type A sorting domain-containing protein, partial [Chitinophagales bacterium]|nr:T9SS type A sorting domain-containing protein [Chitinophagales bacterium]